MTTFTSVSRSSREWRLIEDGDLAVVTIRASPGQPPESIRPEFLHIDEGRVFVLRWADNMTELARQWATAESPGLVRNEEGDSNEEQGSNEEPGDSGGDR